MESIDKRINGNVIPVERPAYFSKKFHSLELFTCLDVSQIVNCESIESARRIVIAKGACCIHTLKRV